MIPKDIGGPKENYPRNSWDPPKKYPDGVSGHKKLPPKKPVDPKSPLILEISLQNLSLDIKPQKLPKKLLDQKVGQLENWYGKFWHKTDESRK